MIQKYGSNALRGMILEPPKTEESTYAGSATADAGINGFGTKS